jgi:hypothetical protein
VAYTDFTKLPEYKSKVAGAAVAVVIYDANKPSQPIIGNCSGINATDEFEQNVVEQAGEVAPDEIVPGRNTISFTINGFWTSEREDLLPTQRDFVGREFTVYEVRGEDQASPGEILRVYTGCKITRYNVAHGARGLKTLDLAFVALERIPGKVWSEDAAP